MGLEAMGRGRGGVSREEKTCPEEGQSFDGSRIGHD
jgi:hypothetical protein